MTFPGDSDSNVFVLLDGMSQIQILVYSVWHQCGEPRGFIRIVLFKLP